ncbi:phage tail tape measure protein [Inquilinus limosus]|uniref:Phage tail tape measure protein domain-containing protein n=1 Tax=Inquilinus limosus MP06 TaxID=1398085 RepID=A0A0A0DE02_9PROT|nr:phage tail tape measure protein [Inquilinus limosus]KGM36128.1 hypothetical protein P409_00335 [Inquilinus limosus MP06]
MADDTVYNIDVTTGNSTAQVDKLAKSFELLAAKIEDVTQAFTGQMRRSTNADGITSQNPRFNQILKERVELLRELSVVTRTLSSGSPNATVNRARLQGQGIDQAFTGTGLAAREIEQVQKQIRDFQKASASAEAVTAARRKTDLKAVTDASQAELAIQAQILKIIRQKGDIETKGATKSRQATLDRYQDELRQLVNLQTQFRKQDDTARRNLLSSRGNVSAANSQVGLQRSALTGDISAFRSQISQMNLLDEATRKSAQDQISQFKQVAEAAGLYYGRTEATIRNVENYLNNQSRRQMRGTGPSSFDKRQDWFGQAISAAPDDSQKLDLQIRQVRDRLKNEQMTTAEMREQLRVLNQLTDQRQKLNLRDVRDPAKITERNQTASAYRNDMVFGSGASDFFRFQGGLMLNYAILSKAQQGVSALSGSVVSLDEAMHDLAAITGSNDEQMGLLGAVILDVSTKTKFLSTETAEGAKILAQAGQSVEEIKESLGGVALFASATGTAFKDSADLMTSTLSVFNMRASESLNLANLFTAALNQTKLNSEQLSLAIQYVANTAAQANIPIEELVADVGSLANAGIRSGSTIGTGLRALFIDLMNPTQKLQAEMKKLGLTFADIDIQTRGLNPVIQTLTEKGFGVSEAFRSMETRAAAAFVALQGQKDIYNDLLASIVGTNAAVDANQKQMEALSNTARNTASVFTALASEAFAPVVSILQKALAGFNELAGSLTGLGPVLGYIGVAAAGLTTALGVTLLARLLGVGAAVAGVGAYFTNALAALGAFRAGITTLGTTMAAVIGPTGWIALAVIGVMGLVTWLGSMKSAGEEAAEAVDHIQASLASAKAKYDDNQKALQNVNEELERMSRQEKTLRGDKDALGNMVSRLNDRFGDLGLSIDGTADTFDKVQERLENFRKEIQGQTILAIRELQVELDKLNRAQQRQLQVDNPLLQGLRQGFSPRGFLGFGSNPFTGLDKEQQYLYSTGGRDAVITRQIEGLAGIGLPASVVQALRDSQRFREGLGSGDLQAMRNTTLQARSSLVDMLNNPEGLQKMADDLGMSVEDLTGAFENLLASMKAQSDKIAENLKTQKAQEDQKANERIERMSQNPYNPAFWLGRTAVGLNSAFRGVQSAAPMDSIDKNRYLQQNGNLLSLGMQGVSGLAGMLGPEFKEAVNRAANGALVEMETNISKAMEESAVASLEEWKTFLPEALKAAEGMVKMSQGGVQKALGTGGFQEALSAYRDSLQITLGTMTKEFVAKELGNDPTNVGFDLGKFAPTDVGPLSDQQAKQLAVFLSGQATDFMVQSAAAIAEQLKDKAGDATSPEEILELNKQASKAVNDLLLPLVEALKTLRDGATDPSIKQQIDSQLVGLMAARDSMVQGYTTTTTEALQTFNDRVNEAGQKVFQDMTQAASGLPTQVMSKAEREKWASTFQGILDAKKNALLREYLAALMTLPGMVEQKGFIKMLTPEGEKAFDFMNSMLTAQNNDDLKSFLNPKTKKYGGGGGRDRTNEKLLKPWEQWNDRQAEIDREYDRSTRDIQNPSRILDIALGANDFMKSYSSVERKALEMLKSQQEAAELPKVLQAEQARRDRLQELLTDFNKVNDDRLVELKKVYDDPKFDNAKRNSALSEYNKILSERRDIQDKLTESTNTLADAQEKYNVSVGQGTGSNMTLGQQLSAAVQQMAEEAGMLTSLTDQIGNEIPGTLDNVRGSFSTFLSDISANTKSVGAAFRDMASSIIQSLLKIASEKAATGILGSLLGLLGGGADGITNLGKGVSAMDFYTDPAGGGGGGFGGFLSSIGSWLGFNGGGMIRAAMGKHIKTRDAVPVWARDGEFILRNSAVSAIGADNLKAINAMGNSRISQSAPPVFQPANQNGGKVNVYVVAPDQKPSLGPNDIIATINDDILKGGSTKKLIKQINMGTI